MEHEPTLEELHKRWHGTLKSYLVGFISCLVLTIASFLLVALRLFSPRTLILTIVGLGVVQAIIQLLFFLHLGHESRPKWESFVFIFMVAVLLILVLGSLWIMSDLNHRMMMTMTN